MPYPLTATDVAALHHSADRAAQRLVLTYRLPPHEREDLRQDLLIDLVVRLRAFDPERGTLGAFTATCLAHHAGRLAGRLRRGRAAAAPVSLDDPLPGTDGMTRGDILAEADGYAAWVGQPVDSIAALERRLDLERALGTLSRTTLPLCAALAEHTPHELARSGREPRSSLYRRVRELRLHLLAVGLPAAA